MGLAAVVLTTDDVSYRLVGGGLYGYMAWTLGTDREGPNSNATLTHETESPDLDYVVSDEFVTVLDKGSKEADELVAVEVTEEKRKGGASGYRIELEFMSEHGYYRLFTSETYVLGATNRTSLVALESQIREFMGLKQLPDWMKEENLDNVQKRHERREENAKKK
ncbi:hypothetical protein HKX48_003661 [Thoreauomyces humboldtii]|nr:hypothetical protein HKX48_003661 [Thoreauomyces humboldtii]